MNGRIGGFCLRSVFTLSVGLCLASPAASQTPTCEPLGSAPFVFLGGRPPDLILFPGCVTEMDDHENENLTELVPASIDSPVLTKSAGNPYKQIGTWSARFSSLLPSDITRIGTYHPVLFLGLRDSDDEGTRFDVKVELLIGSDVVTEGETLCIAGVTRNPAKAKEVHISPFPTSDYSVWGDPPVSLDVDSGSEFSLRVSARIGTIDPGTGNPCKGHASARGLRLYYNAIGRGARIRLLKWCPPGVVCQCPPGTVCLPPIRD